jgi:hypothetical protein
VRPRRISLAAFVVIGALLAAYLATRLTASSTAASRSTGVWGVVPVTVRTLRAMVAYSGTVGYAEPRSVYYVASTGGSTPTVSAAAAGGRSGASPSSTAGAKRPIRKPPVRTPPPRKPPTTTGPTTTVATTTTAATTTGAPTTGATTTGATTTGATTTGATTVPGATKTGPQFVVPPVVAATHTSVGVRKPVRHPAKALTANRPRSSTSGGPAVGAKGSAGAGSASGSQNTLTGIVAVGSLLPRGRVLLTINSQPTVLLYGTFPMYRTLQSGVANGVDIEQLKRNLVALGYATRSMVINQTWDADLTAAVDAWEASLGVTEDGAVPASRVLFTPGPIVVQTAASIGSGVSVTAPVMTVTAPQRIVSIPMTLPEASAIRVGDHPAVTLASGTAIRGRVAMIGTDAVGAASSSGGGGGAVTNATGPDATTSGATVTVTVDLPTSRALDGVTGAPVSVEFATAVSANVLSVPTTALVTLPDGATGVDVVAAGDTPHGVAVTPGAFASGGYVQVSGAIHAGEQVRIPA